MFLKGIMFKTKFYRNIYNVFVFNKVGSKQAHLKRVQNVSMKNPWATQVTIVHNQTVEMQAECSSLRSKPCEWWIISVFFLCFLRDISNQFIFSKWGHILATCSLTLTMNLGGICRLSEWMMVAQYSPTLCDPMDCSLPGSSVRGILQARILEWVAISFSNLQVRT